MKTFEKLFEELSKLVITQKSMDWAENIPDDIWDQWFDSSYNEVAYGLNIDTHRWYETSITVIRIYNDFLGIEYVSNLFSESSDVDDICHTIKFHKMEEIQTTSYKIKK